MKNIAIIIILLQFAFSSFCQNDSSFDLFYDLHGVYANGILQSDLAEANELVDLDERYPESWVKEYISVEITSTSGDIVNKATGESGTLTADQKTLLSSAEHGAEVKVVVKYIPDNNLNENEAKTLDFAFNVLPAIEAQFSEGAEQLEAYLEKYVANAIPESVDVSALKYTAVRFSIDTDGQVVNTKAIGSSNFEDVDQILLSAINEMPQWIPARNASHVRVSQDFELVFGNSNSSSCYRNLVHQ